MTSYVLITRQPEADGPKTNVYGPESKPQGELSPQEFLDAAGRILIDGALPPMTYEVLPCRPAKWFFNP